MNIKVRLFFQPILFGLFPIAFLYNNNLKRLNPDDVALPLAIALLLWGLVVGLVFLFVRKINALFCLISSIILLVFSTYGVLFQVLSRQHSVVVEHYNLLPALLVLLGYGIWLVLKTQAQTRKNLTDIFLVISGALFLFNLIPSVYGETKEFIRTSTPSHNTQTSAQEVNGLQPDIFYIMLDEYSSFRTMKEYFGYDNSAFKTYLEDKGFFVADNSLGLTPVTKVEVASRLNYQSYASEKDEWGLLLTAIRNNKVAAQLKSLGYKVIVMDTAWLDAGSFADITFENYDEQNIRLGIDEFTTIYIRSTVLIPIWDAIARQGNPEDIALRQSVLSAIDNFINLEDYQDPVFVYAHLLLPHPPFVFDKDGNRVPPQFSRDFNYYVGQHQFATKTAMRMIDTVLAKANPNNPPIIILQSDHGVRPYVTETETTKIANFNVDEYPESEKMKILNALYLPGVDYSRLTDDLDPLSVFPIIFEEYFSIQVE